MTSFSRGFYYWFSLIYLIIRTLAVSLYSAEINDESKRPVEVLRAMPRESWCLEVNQSGGRLSSISFNYFFTLSYRITDQEIHRRGELRRGGFIRQKILLPHPSTGAECCRHYHHLCRNDLNKLSHLMFDVLISGARVDSIQDQRRHHRLQSLPQVTTLSQIAIYGTFLGGAFPFYLVSAI